MQYDRSTWSSSKKYCFCLEQGKLVRLHLLPILAYLLLTIVFTWPVAAHFTTHIPGGGDAPWFLWQFWWFKHSILDLRQLPYTTDLIYYPLTDVPVMAQTPVNELFTIPIQVAFNLVILNNLLFFLSYVFSGYFTYLLGYRLVRRRDLAFLGGIFFAFCAYRGMRGWGHMSLLTTQWMPLTLLLGYQLWLRPTWQRGVALGISAALVALASPYYIGLFLFPVAMAALFILVGQRLRQVGRWALWRAGLLAGSVLGGCVMLAYAHYFYLEEAIYTITRQLSTEVATYSADLLSWLLPPAMNPLWQTYTAPRYANFTTPNLMETTLFVGYLPLGLLVLSCFLRPSSPTTRFWQLLALIALLLSLGPTLHIAGVAYFDWLPYRLLLALPGFDSFRIPSRAGVTAALALSVLSMLVLQQLSQQVPQRLRRAVIGLLALLFLVNNLTTFPHPLSDAAIPPVYDALVNAPTGKALLDLPAGEFFTRRINFFSEFSMAMYYQTYHHWPLVSGYLGRHPERLYEPERTLPFVRRFFNDGPNQSTVAFPSLRGLPAPFWPTDVATAPTLLRRAGIGAVALHCSSPNALDSCRHAIPLLNYALGLPHQISGPDRIYLVAPSPYQQSQLPTYMTNLALDYSPAFVRLPTETLGRVYQINADGAIRFAVPMTGTWQISGEWVGTQIDQVALLLDQQTLMMTVDNSLPQVHSWQTVIPLAAGWHELTVQSAPATPPSSAWPCAKHCLRNLHVRLAQPQSTVPERALLTLVDRDNHHAMLLDARLLSTPTDRATALQSNWLLTSWQLDSSLWEEVQQAPEQLPAFFVHLTDPNGTIQAQADHRLGEHSLYVAANATLYDFTLLPSAAADQDQLELRLGLWYPTRASYYWSTTGEQIDAANRFQAGTIGSLRTPFLLPDFTIDPAHYYTFVAPVTASTSATLTTFSAAPTEPLTLLSAQIITPSVADTTPQLLTIWRISEQIDTRNVARVTVQLTTLQGKVLHALEQPLGANNLIADSNEFIVDVIPLPQLTLSSTTIQVALELWSPAYTQPYMRFTPQGEKAETPQLPLGTWAALTQLADQALRQ